VSLINESEIDHVGALLAPLSHELDGRVDDIFETLYEFGRSTSGFRRRSTAQIAQVARRGDLRAAVFLTSRWENLSASERATVRVALVELLDDDPAVVPSIRDLALSVNLRADDREPFVRAFLRAYRRADGELKATALEAAERLAAPSRTARRLIDRVKREAGEQNA